MRKSNKYRYRVPKSLLYISFCLFVIVTLLFFTINPVFAISNSAITADSAVAIDADTGEILFQKNAFQIKAPASTTKILTAILAIESGRLEELVTVSKRAAAVGESSIYLRTHDQLVLSELVHGALIKSGNDACVAIAEHLSPSEDEFVGMMNFKAQLLGAYNTTFYNTNGLPHRSHLTTAYDLAIIARYALQNPIFSKIVSTKEYTLQWTTPSSRTVYIRNTNKLLWTFPGATGVKTGTTNQAGNCLVASAKQDNHHIISVVLNSQNRYGDAQKLLEYGFQIKENQTDAE